MAGFVADYASGEIFVDGNELEDARWFSRAHAGISAARAEHRTLDH